jgi:dihydroorotase
MNPPLRSEHDRQAVRRGLADGTLDVIATDHAPHSSIEKDLEFNLAANGIIGLETALPLSLALVRDGVLDLAALLAKLTINPARILGLSGGLRAGSKADITIIDPDQRHMIDAARFRSLSRNTPFDGWPVQGRAVVTIVGGRVVFDELSAQA